MTMVIIDQRKKNINHDLLNQFNLNLLDHKLSLCKFVSSLFQLSTPRVDLKSVVYFAKNKHKIINKKKDKTIQESNLLTSVASITP